jgi:hypothetical protein
MRAIGWAVCTGRRCPLWDLVRHSVRVTRVAVRQAGITEGENEAASASHDLTRASFEYVKVLPRGVTRSNCWLQGLYKATRNAGHLHDCMAEHRHPHTFVHGSCALHAPKVTHTVWFGNHVPLYDLLHEVLSRPLRAAQPAGA